MKPAHVRAIIKRRDAFEKGLRELIEEGMADGSIVPCSPKLAIFVAMGALNWSRKWYDPKGDWSGPQIAAALTQMLERGLARKPGAALVTDLSAIDIPAGTLDEAPVRQPRRPA